LSAWNIYPGICLYLVEVIQRIKQQTTSRCRGYPKGYIFLFRISQNLKYLQSVWMIIGFQSEKVKGEPWVKLRAKPRTCHGLSPVTSDKVDLIHHCPETLSGVSMESEKAETNSYFITSSLCHPLSFRFMTSCLRPVSSTHVCCRYQNSTPLIKP